MSLSAVKQQHRIFEMDVIRGVAVLGILMVNIPAFAGNEFSLVWNDVLAHKLTFNGFIFKSMQVMLEGKMRGLFTLLFGAGIMLFIANKKDKSIQVADAYMRRMMWLLLLGVIDGYLLLWTGDVLYEYALCGLLLFAFRNLRARYLIAAAAVAISIFTWNTGKMFTKYKNQSVVYKQSEQLLKEGRKLNEEQTKMHEEFNNILGHHMPFSKQVMEELKTDVSTKYIVYHSGYNRIFEDQKEEVFESQTSNFYTNFYETFGTILLGMALFKLGFFEYRFRLSTYRLFCFIGIPVGIALYVLEHKLQAKTQAELWEAYSWRPFSTFYIESPARILLILGYASALMLLCRLYYLKFFLALIANTGRMALSNYITQTIICIFYFYGFGLGYYGQYNASQLLCFVVCVWLVQITWSNFYLRYFEIGPLEWVWKRLTYGKDESTKLL